MNIFRKKPEIVFDCGFISEERLQRIKTIAEFYGVGMSGQNLNKRRFMV